MNICPRAIRLMIALVNRPITREEADKIAKASNSPHYIMLLRRRLGLELECVRVPFLTSDGDSSWFGRYHATPDDKAKIRTYLAAVEAANDGQEKAPPKG